MRSGSSSRNCDVAQTLVSASAEASSRTREVDTVWVQEIWRYPVKSMAGESLKAADLTKSVVVGDRVVQVRNASGRMITARTRPLLLRHRAMLSSDNQILIDGRPWTANHVARDLESASATAIPPLPP